ncbi:hypothetical protein Clacol_005908 [Clathrus columnatus]|uniref:RebB like protein n=1 Tax=Clathrus columnatus TaxID=1419009 RepID=A0AAV5AAL8_9AGAM|nr:hypothetical protein Clacol_005908 [Clathrus columnatus]
MTTPTLSSQVTDPPVSGLNSAVSIQAQTAIENAITIAGTVYQSPGLHKTSALDSLPGPVAQDDGLAILNSYKEVQIKISVLLSAMSVGVASIEQGAPGLCDFIERLTGNHAALKKPNTKG